jgi:hypothetical protein
VVGLRTASLVEIGETHVTVRLRSSRRELVAGVAEQVERALLEQARATGELVLVEAAPGEAPCVVGVLQTRLLTGIKGANLSFEATEALTLRSGRAGLRLTKDGDVELLGTRISAASRGVMRLVGHVLRLN